MNQQGNPTCPYCGAPISSTDKYCKNCGKTLIAQPEVTQPQPKPPWPTPSPAPEQPYEREYSVPQRLYKLIVSPNKAMQDIGLAPEYTGPILLIVFRTILLAVTISLAYSKIQWAGDPNLISQVSGFLSGVITLAIVIAVGLLVAYWLGKALIVKYTCDSGSAWTFTTAASVTGYSYLPELILGIISITVVYPMIPQITFNVSDLAATRAALADYRVQLLWIQIIFSVPISIISLIWKSYLGGLGTKFGTQKKASLALGFTVFLILGLLGWGISYLLTGRI
jgi:hypothetical protein